jgi:hypothetical protein
VFFKKNVQLVVDLKIHLTACVCFVGCFVKMVADLGKCALKKTSNQNLAALLVGQKFRECILLKEIPNPSLDVLVTN